MPLTLPNLKSLILGERYTLTLTTSIDGGSVNFSSTPVTFILDPPLSSTQSRITYQHLGGGTNFSVGGGTGVVVPILPAVTKGMDVGVWIVYFGVGTIGTTLDGYGPYRLPVITPPKGTLPWV